MWEAFFTNNASAPILPKLEARMIEFLAEWRVTFLIPATHVLEVRAPHLSFMFLKEYWFRELYVGLKVKASFDRSESYTRVLDGQVRCITPEIKPQNLQVIWNVQFITVFVPAWMIPPVYHSLRRESIKNASSAPVQWCPVCPPHLVRRPRGALFFSLEFGRCRSEARSLHEHKL